MCKSADDPNGPYRCPADAQKGLDRASAKLAKAMIAVDEAKQEAEDAEADANRAAARVARIINADDAPWVRNGRTAPAREHVEDMIKEGLVPEESRDLPPSEVFESYRLRNNVPSRDRSLPRYADTDNPDYQAAREAVNDGYKRRARALRTQQTRENKVRAAQADVRGARTDYEATTRGLGELQAQYDEAARVSGEDAPHVERLARRIHSAKTFMNVDAMVRLTKRGRDPKDFAYAPLRTGESDHRPKDGNQQAAHYAQRDRITGVSKAYRPGTPEAGDGQTLHMVTLTRRDDDGLHEEKFRISVPEGHPTPTCADVIQEVSRRAREHDVASNFEEWRDFNDYPDKATDPAAYAEAKKTYASHAADAQRFAKFLGPARYDEYRRGAQ